MSKAIRKKNCNYKNEKQVAILATFPNKDLAKKLDLVHIQSVIAEIEIAIEEIETFVEKEEECKELMSEFSNSSLASHPKV